MTAEAAQKVFVVMWFDHDGGDVLGVYGRAEEAVARAVECFREDAGRRYEVNQYTVGNATADDMTMCIEFPYDPPPL